MSSCFAAEEATPLRRFFLFMSFLLADTYSFAVGLGFLLGLKHATEADHLIAVTTIVSEQRSVLRSSFVGAIWGVGHTLSLLSAGVLVILLRVAIPERIATGVGLAVALMIVVLGGRVLYAVWRAEPDCHCHTLPGQTRPRTSWKPLLIGMMHGLAGSAGLTLLILTDVMRGGSALHGVAYLLIFGLGSIGGMMMMSAVVSLPFVFTANRFEQFSQPIKFVAGMCSVLFGLYYAWQVLSGQPVE